MRFEPVQVGGAGRWRGWAGSVAGDAGVRGGPGLIRPPTGIHGDNGAPPPPAELDSPARVAAGCQPRRGLLKPGDPAREARPGPSP
ncbi:MAG: hypothetical protein ACK587_07345 [Cyanobacteriota bacterium]